MRDTVMEREQALKRLVAEQAEDEGLWAPATNIQTAYLQQELRRLHAAIEEDG